MNTEPQPNALKAGTACSEIEEPHVRWLQRFENYRKALGQLRKFIEKGELSELEEQGLIKAFEYTYELGWNTLKDYLRFQGYASLTGSRDTIRESLAVALIEDGDVWMSMLQDRNRTSHTYNEATAAEISAAIKRDYWESFRALESKLLTLSGSGQ